MRFVDVDPINDRAGWLERRRHGLGGSDIAKVLGVSEWGSPWTVYVDKVGAVPLDEESTEWQRLGQLLEPVILSLYQEDSGYWVGRPQTMILHPDHDWLFATVDSLAYDVPDPGPDDTPVRGVDAKRSKHFSFDDGIPLDYQAQAQHSMLVTGLPAWDLAVLHPTGFRIYTIEADYDDQATILRRAEQFWRDHVEAGVPPDVTGDDNRLLADVWPEQREGTRVDVDAAAVAELVRVKAEQKVLDGRRNELEATLKATLADTEEGVVDGRKAVSWKAQRAVSNFDAEAFEGDNPFMVPRFRKEKTVEYLDSAAIKEEEPDIYRKYTKPTRVFRTHIKPDELEEID